jgi:hypothetical protein
MAQHSPSADPTTTRQYAGHIKHAKHLAEQREDVLSRRKGKRKAKREAKANASG